MEERLAVLESPGAGLVALEAASPVGPGDEESAPWPDGATAMEIGEAGPEVAVPSPPNPGSPGAVGPLPSLDALVARIPAAVREELDDLFRVKFINVQRISASALKVPLPAKD